MRIVIVNWSRRRVGGVETYLNTVIPELRKGGHLVAFLHEIDEPRGLPAISLPADALSWCVAETGPERALRELREWHPDLVYLHKVESLELEEQLLSIAPSVYFAHDYHGMCISGTKTFTFPVARPCGRRFDVGCLAHYYPRRCGGLNPVTMVRLYLQQSARLEHLHRYDAIVTHSGHMQAELVKQGLPAERVHSFPYYVRQRATIADAPDDSAGETWLRDTPARPYVHLLFSARMELLKGGHVLLEALPAVAARLQKPVRVTFAGDGRARPAWQRRAALLQATNGQIVVDFAGWVDRRRMDTILDDCDLLVVPSLWPEPFGLVGPEAGLRGIPVAAFDVGGIPDWLVDGMNGFLAPADPPTPDGLATAIVRCLEDPRLYGSLRRHAVVQAKKFDIEHHLSVLVTIFEKLVAAS